MAHGVLLGDQQGVYRKGSSSEEMEEASLGPSGNEALTTIHGERIGGTQLSTEQHGEEPGRVASSPGGTQVSRQGLQVPITEETDGTEPSTPHTVFRQIVQEESKQCYSLPQESWGQISRWKVFSQLFKIWR
ncbi:unnamed protein product [Calypogeia fissa]